MLKHLFLLIILILASCSANTEPVLQDASSLEDTLPREYYDSIPTEYYGFIGRYITEDLKDGLYIYYYNCFAYVPNCNKSNDWRVGKWQYSNDTIKFNYEDGGKAIGIWDSIIIKYYDDNFFQQFYPSSDVDISVEINPDFEE